VEALDIARGGMQHSWSCPVTIRRRDGTLERQAGNQHRVAGPYESNYCIAERPAVAASLRINNIQNNCLMIVYSSRKAAWPLLSLTGTSSTTEALHRYETMWESRHACVPHMRLRLILTCMHSPFRRRMGTCRPNMRRGAGSTAGHRTWLVLHVCTSSKGLRGTAITV
jgi:hypothetical protein